MSSNVCSLLKTLTKFCLCNDLPIARICHINLKNVICKTAKNIGIHGADLNRNSKSRTSFRKLTKRWVSDGTNNRLEEGMKQIENLQRKPKKRKQHPELNPAVGPEMKPDLNVNQVKQLESKNFFVKLKVKAECCSRRPEPRNVGRWGPTKRVKVQRKTSWRMFPKIAYYWKSNA